MFLGAEKWVGRGGLGEPCGCVEGSVHILSFTHPGICERECDWWQSDLVTCEGIFGNVERSLARFWGDLVLAWVHPGACKSKVEKPSLENVSADSRCGYKANVFWIV